ncbi:MAG: UDP-N-acetylmuramoyl-tripeptide--D-alanyl-D-alanine ligase, partial [bacterium]|nr:UDP-N-acetylmuramoyl-tripeptide--D-alanyl-D-alanine ligase [bacterium]
FLLAVRKIFYWVWLWQLKEYRLDRVLVHLQETEQGKNIFFSKLSILKLSAIFSFILIGSDSRLLTAYQVFILLVFIYEAYLLYKELSKKKFKKPVFTIKALILVCFAFALTSILFVLPFVDRYLWILILDKLTPFFVAFFIFIFSFPSTIYTDIQIERAIKKIRENRHLLVIGVTGSYGKSSTKEYLSQILSKKFKVAKTRGTNNTPIGIANSILKDLADDTKIFVVEMGAYQKGEIKELCQIVAPKIGIITAINNQHLSLFGNIKNTMSGKYELIESLPKNGLALFNGNNENAKLLFEKTEINKVLYETLQSMNKKSKESTICAFNIKTQKSSISFDIQLKKEVTKMYTSLIGAHNVENILPAIFIANYLGMSMEEIQVAVENLTSLPKTMEKYTFSNNATLIDDSFNTNPNSILAVLNYIQVYKGIKVLVMQPMIELGKDSKLEHEKIGEEISKISDYLFLTNNNYYKYILKGCEKRKNNCVIEVASTKTISDFIIKNVKEDDVVLFEGKESNAVLSKFL